MFTVLIIIYKKKFEVIIVKAKSVRYHIFICIRFDNFFC